MAITGRLFGKAFVSLFNAEVDWDSHAIKVSLHTSAYTPDQDVHDYFDDATNQITGTGYTAGGEALASKTVTYTAGTNKLMLDAADVTWAASTLTARTAVVYNSTPATDATRPLLGYQQSDADIISTAGNFVITWHASGIIEVTVS